jgi:hypothetical protein
MYIQLYNQFIPKYDLYKAGQVEGGGNSVEVLVDSVGSLDSMVGLSFLLLFLRLNVLSNVDVEQHFLGFFFFLFFLMLAIAALLA